MATLQYKTIRSILESAQGELKAIVDRDPRIGVRALSKHDSRPGTRISVFYQHEALQLLQAVQGMGHSEVKPS